MCPRFTSNSLLARFLSLEHGWGCPSPECPSSAQPISKPQLLGCSLAQSQHFLGEAPTLAPCQASGLQRDFFPPREVLGSSCCQRVEACSAFSPWKTPGCGPALPPALAPFRIFSFYWVKGLPASVLWGWQKSGFSLEFERWGMEILVSHSDGGTEHPPGACTVPAPVLILAHWVFEAWFRVNIIQSPPFFS